MTSDEHSLYQLHTAKLFAKMTGKLSEASRFLTVRSCRKSSETSQEHTSSRPRFSLGCDSVHRSDKSQDKDKHACTKDQPCLVRQRIDNASISGSWCRCAPARCPIASRGKLLCKVTTIESSSICCVDDDASIAEEGEVLGVGRKVEVEVSDLKVLVPSSVGNDFMFPAQIAGLASIWLGRNAGRSFVTTVRREMAASAGAVAICRDSKFVNVICCKRKGQDGQDKAQHDELSKLTEGPGRSIRESKEIDAEVDSSAIVTGDARDLALDRFVLLQNGLERGHLGVVFSDWGIVCCLCRHEEGHGDKHHQCEEHHLEDVLW